jgi:predicted secreted protein
MKQKIIPIFMIIIVLLALPSCIVTSRAIGVEISCNEFNENPHSIRNEFQVEIGDKITVKLCSNPTTGFQWDYETTVENVLKEEDHDFEELEGDIPGAMGREIWTFEAVKKGTTKVQMEYSQPWEGGSKAEWAYMMTVTVN